MHRLRFFVIALSVGLSAACASGGTPAEGTTGVTRSSGPITRAELAPLSQFSAFDAVRRLRPRWLSTRGTGQLPTVFIDRSPRGEPRVLAQIPANTVERINFLPARDATTRYGTGYAYGIIEVITRRGG